MGPIHCLSRSLVMLGSMVAGWTLLATVGAGSAEVFKCTNASGKVEFTDAPCEPAQTSARVDARPHTLDNSAVREQLLQIENRSLQDKPTAARPAAATPLQGPVEVARSDTPARRSAVRDVEAAATSVENNKALIRARQSAMHVVCGVREPDRQITNVNVGDRGERGERPYVDPRTSTR